jgi:hypothetical protein
MEAKDIQKEMLPIWAVKKNGGSVLFLRSISVFAWGLR